MVRLTKEELDIVLERMRSRAVFWGGGWIMWVSGKRIVLKSGVVMHGQGADRVATLVWKMPKYEIVQERT